MLYLGHIPSNNERRVLIQLADFVKYCDMPSECRNSEAAIDMQLKGNRVSTDTNSQRHESVWRKFQGERKIGCGSQMGAWHQDRLADWLSVVN
jgi:hypothetical protein